MKNTIGTSIIVFILIAAVLVVLFVRGTQKEFAAVNNTGAEKLYLVNANDLIKSAKSYLESGDEQQLNDSLGRTGYSLTLSDLNGRVLFSDSKATQPVDINTMLSHTGAAHKALLVSYGENETLRALAFVDTRSAVFDAQLVKQRIFASYALLGALFIALCAFLFWYISTALLRPFWRLESVAGDIAKGNLDAPLAIGRRNPFGAFTWAFDMLRTELKASKAREEKADRSKKELVASLSHDVRTPVASIRAYAEVLMGLPDKNSDRAARYLHVIVQKTEEISNLTQDLFTHALMDLEELAVTPEPCTARELFISVLEPLKMQYESDIVIEDALPDVTVLLDPRRIVQVCENIVSNSAKYAPGCEIRFRAFVREGEFVQHCALVCQFRDSGSGVTAKDLPFLFDKFYRGSNAKESGAPGSGLGLYTSKYILEKCGGAIRAGNWSENGKFGFEVSFSLKIL